MANSIVSSFLTTSKVSDPSDLEARLSSYFAQCAREERSPIFTELCLVCGCADKREFMQLCGNGSIGEQLRKAMLYIESQYERKLDSARCVGAIFALKNFGWTDSQTPVTVNVGGLADVQSAILANMRTALDTRQEEPEELIENY